MHQENANIEALRHEVRLNYGTSMGTSIQSITSTDFTAAINSPINATYISYCQRNGELFFLLLKSLDAILSCVSVVGSVVGRAEPTT